MKPLPKFQRSKYWTFSGPVSQTMFPSMDMDVIETVLRANNGAVDATIDQLLTLTEDMPNAPQQPQHPQLPVSDAHTTHGFDSGGEARYCDFTRFTLSPK